MNSTFVSTAWNAFTEWLYREPVLAILGFSALTFLLTLLLMLMARKRHGDQRFAEGRASLTEYIERLDAELDEAQASLRELQEENRQLSTQRLHLTAQVEHHKTQAARVSPLETQNRQLQQELTALSNEKATLQTRLQEQQRFNEEQKEAQKREREKAETLLTEKFQNLAQRIFDEKSRKFTQQNQQNLKATLSPLQTQLGHFQELIRKTHEEDVEKQSVLLQEINNLKQLNLNISEEARNLTRALTSESKTQGNWGELVLERVLESSGLQKGREYETQKSYSQEGKHYLPDVIIHLPQGKDLIIDAKVSLTAYERYRNAENESDRERYLKEHIDSLRKHMRQLADKAYHDLDGLNTIDLVLMFVPVEPAYLEAMNADPGLMEEAFSKKVLMLSTSNLLATLRTVSTLWQNEKRNKNALEIARQAGALYDKFVGFCDDLNEIKRRLDQADRAWHNAENKLTSGRGNLVGATRRLQDLGAKTSKELEANWLEKSNDQGGEASTPDENPTGTDSLPSPLPGEKTE